MPSRLLLNVAREETRVALLEGRVVREIYIDRKAHRSTLGNIYKGRVSRVLPGMEAAFIDIGLPKAAFLHVDDIRASGDQLPTSAFDDGEEEGTEATAEEAAARPVRPPIQELIREGQEIVVQVQKEAISTKGPRVTTYISLPGRYLVYMPEVEHVGISRKIDDEQERERLRGLVDAVRRSGEGFVVRTVSAGCSGREVTGETAFLRKLWEAARLRAAAHPAPVLLHTELDLATRTIRDLMSDDVDRLIIDSPTEHARLKQVVAEILPELAERIELYEGDELLFDHYGVELELSRALKRRVWLRSGGYLVIDQTEALTAIDVNTGRFVGKRNLEDTILRTNLEAAEEIAYQLRLRNLGGIIICDFIDMELPDHRQRVYEHLVDATAGDRARTTIYPISELGLIEMTRKRVRESLGQVMLDLCPACDGTGRVRSAITVTHDIFREVRRLTLPNRTGGRIQISAHPDIVDLLYGEERLTVDELELAYQCRIEVEASDDPDPDHFRVRRLPA
ncbi:MAG: Rne/Rng family ribonuclease [Nitrospirae bacterium CG18_big_fil_WC_8_21_14_2_50_70_55]|nr:Rne/Rng family ribonuclease [Deltaproteobacteria bacterium]OIP66236.1 MAG: ribonuclease E/G [Nitrospirae bacterium CG2_30_70_394]PIQ03149.1 MAG: Rne/Rng family ribonuclease [Nitrospirae bacterium CG18_big_fil_WC_8_21_14_2_50_70_55]PIU78307.1 MAG: Rne/Rng family ribonuclease [Nitrospirae bacterium CG06_land_8_20_14_3_00_70_43]PIW82326.1 MAG: Rne/Rng family ribonuclease [Nitrospirae bacterium CG_4_8_14_3_um_filter_70_85]PIX83750.1 MAG: Rne/Rng family ribonuclease [Nitrospirae bacterium CG_4_1